MISRKIEICLEYVISELSKESNFENIKVLYELFVDGYSEE